jgi:L-alanine-DL-glutamate epimerase-like enolase superfamily enzyme
MLRVTGLRASRLSVASEPLYLLELTTDEALVGIAFAREDVLPQARALVSEVLLGEDPRAVTELWHEMSRASAAASVHAAAAALDIALWDLKSKANLEPLWKTLGGSRPRVNVHAGAHGISGSELREHGFRGAKLHVGVDPTAELSRLAELQDALRAQTSEPVLIIDAEERWSAKDAIRCVRELERSFDLAWVEAATSRHDHLGLKRISNAIRSAVCAGAGLGGLAQLLPHLHHRSLDIVQLDTACLGISAALQLADAAFGLELPVSLCDSPGNMNAQLAGALPSVVSLEVCNPARALDVLVSDVTIEHGWAVAGDHHGHGVRVQSAPGAAS